MNKKQLSVYDEVNVMFKSLDPIINMTWKHYPSALMYTYSYMKYNQIYLSIY